ncbi:MAG: undecaprenyl-diphosphate phosphatase [Phycisphaerae bacterium]
MLDLVRAIVLGIIEGLTEFIPVSSTGHLLLAYPLLGIDGNAPRWQVFLIVCQLGAIAAVAVYFWRELAGGLFHMRPPLTNHLLTKLAVVTAPALVVGAATNALVDRYLANPPSVALALIVGALLIEWVDGRYRRSAPMTIEDVSFMQAFWIGVLQCLSIVWPGISRAGATIMGGMLVGLTPAVAAEFSFFAAIPAITAATVYKLWKLREHLDADDAAIIGVGTAVAFVVALLVIAGFMNYVRTRRFRPFAIYRVVLGIGVLIAYFAG